MDALASPPPWPRGGARRAGARRRSPRHAARRGQRGKIAVGRRGGRADRRNGNRGGARARHRGRRDGPAVGLCEPAGPRLRRDDPPTGWASSRRRRASSSAGPEADPWSSRSTMPTCSTQLGRAGASPRRSRHGTADRHGAQRRAVPRRDHRAVEGRAHDPPRPLPPVRRAHQGAARARAWRPRCPPALRWALELSLGNPLFPRELVLGAVDSGALVRISDWWELVHEPPLVPRLRELAGARIAGATRPSASWSRWPSPRRVGRGAPRRSKHRRGTRRRGGACGSGARSGRAGERGSLRGGRTPLLAAPSETWD
jgi:hypothetical protein